MALELDPLPASRAKTSFGESLPRRAGTIGLFIAVIWVVWLADALVFHGRLAQYGIVPRTLRGLVGILWAPFLHASLAHVSSNTLGILLLGGLLILRSESMFWAVSLLGALAAGLGTWVIGHNGTVHLGASGVIFAYFGYLLFAGIFQRRFFSLLISVGVFFLWGGMLWSVLPSFAGSGISWEGHLSGLAGGMVAAKVLAQRNPRPGVAATENPAHNRLTRRSRPPRTR